MRKDRIIVIAGKNSIACNAVRYLIEGLSYPRNLVKVVACKGDEGKHTWQPSLVFTAKTLGIDLVSLDCACEIQDALFVSLEFDRIVQPERFSTKSLYNIHFSALPAYRGVGMAVWPIVNGETEAGVTLHEIDWGIDSGNIVSQRRFAIGEDWTARDLYFAFLDEAFALFRDNIESLVDNVACSRPQPAIGASYYSRAELDYGNLRINFKKTANQVYNQLRGYSFWEYQLPIVDGKKIISSEILSTRSKMKPGIKIEGADTFATYATVDYDIKLHFSPYDTLYAWARGENVACSPEGIVDIDRQDANGWSAAMIAAYHAKADRLRKLLELGADVNQSNLRGTTLLMYAKDGALSTGNSAALELVLRYSADVSARDVQGLSVLDYLQRSGVRSLDDLMRNFVK